MECVLCVLLFAVVAIGAWALMRDRKFNRRPYSDFRRPPHR